MKQQSAGILLFRNAADGLEFFLVHPGGPFWKNKDEGSWSIPKGGFLDDEDPLEAAKREFLEETGTLPEGTFLQLEPVKMKSGKIVHGWAVCGNIDAGQIKSNTFEMEWPPKSGRFASFPEVDRGEWFNAAAALVKILPAQSGFINEVIQMHLR